MKKYFLLLFLILLPISVSAKTESKAEIFTVKCDKSSFKEFEEFACRASVNTSFNFDKINFEIVLPSGISIDDVRSNYTALWKLEIENNIVTASVVKNELVNGLQEFGIFLFGTMEFGTQEISFKNITLLNTKEEKTLEVPEVKKEIKVLSSENRLNSILIDGVKINKFASDIYNYTVEIDSEVTKVNIETELIDKNAVVTGNGEIEIDQNSYLTITTINIKSESGVNRTYKINFLRKGTKISNIKVPLIELKDNKKNNIDFKFNPDVYEYNIELDSKIASLNLNITLEDKTYSLVKGFGNRTITIDDGDNTELIKIKNADGEIQTYVLNITKLLSNKSANCYLKTLEIKGTEIKFSKKVKMYTLETKKKIKKLDIKALAEDKKAKVTVIGNEDLKEGSIIKIIVKAENESQFTYQIKIAHVKKSYVLPAIIAAVILSAITSIVLPKKTKKKEKIIVNPKEALPKNITESQPTVKKTPSVNKKPTAKQSTTVSAKKTITKKKPTQKNSTPNKKTTAKKTGSSAKSAVKKTTSSKSVKTNNTKIKSNTTKTQNKNVKKKQEKHLKS